MPRITKETIDSWSRQVDEVVTEYFTLHMEEGSEAALDKFEEYLDKFRPINRKVGIRTRLYPEQFGMIANTASLRYDQLELSGREKIIGALRSFLYGKHTSKIPFFTAELRQTSLLQDILLGDDIFWPKLNATAGMEDMDRNTLTQQLVDPRNNPILFALRATLYTTPAETRDHLSAERPTLLSQGIGIVAARILGRGLYDEYIHKFTPDRPRPVWVNTLQTYLSKHAAPCRPPILEQIAENDWPIRRIPLYTDYVEALDKLQAKAKTLVVRPDGQIGEKEL